MLLYIDYSAETRLRVNRLYQHIINDGPTTSFLTEDDELQASFLVSDVQAE